MNKIIIAVGLLFSTSAVNAQCDSVIIASSLTVSSTTLMSGTYVVQGNFTLLAGSTIYVTPYSSNGCGELKIYANSIFIEGTINGDYAGYEGGAGGSKGLAITSITGHGASLTSCNDEGTQGHINIEGGIGGANGAGPGGGIGGNDGSDGSGTKQYCGSFGDDGGFVAGSGGAGGGAGASYGGVSGAGETGGAGSSLGTPNGFAIESSYPMTSGTGGTGGSSPVVYGSEFGMEIHMGSGGAGGGGGGRSFYFGTDGTPGGNGGGMVFLKASHILSVPGTISVNGQWGNYGGNGGSGDYTSDCCSDGCNGADERTYTAGSGAGSGSGGGSGGGIYLETENIATITGTLTAIGGGGGLSGQKGIGTSIDYDGGIICGTQTMVTGDGTVGGSGGSGSGGRIKIFVPECANATVVPSYNVDGGSNGVSAAAGTYAEVCGYAGLNENKGIAWQMYPNPASDKLTVNLSSLEPQATITITNELGAVVLSTELYELKTSINIEELRDGIYFVLLSSENNQSIQKLIKQ